MTIWWILQNYFLAVLGLFTVASNIFGVKFSWMWNSHQLIQVWLVRFGAIKNSLMFKKNITPINITMWTCCLRINKFTEMIFSFTKISKSQTTLISKVIRKSVGGSGGGFISTWTRINFDRLDFLYERELIVKGN